MWLTFDEEVYCIEQGIKQYSNLSVFVTCGDYFPYDQQL
jgi:hypothetical protein